MEYNLTDILNTEQNKIKDVIVQKLIELKAKGTKEEKVINKVSIMLHNDFLYAAEFKNKYKVNFQILYERFAALIDDYDDFYGGLKIEIEGDTFKDEFKNSARLHENYENCTSLSYEEFVPLFLKYFVIRRAMKRLGDNSELYKLMFEANDFTDFTLEKIEGDIVDSELYQKLKKKLFPNSKVTKANDNISERGTSFETNKDDQEIVKKNLKENKGNIESDEDEEIKEKLDLFSEEEKYLILHAAYQIIQSKKHDPKNIELAEFLRIIRICQGIDDVSIFKKPYTLKFYTSVSKGINYYENLKYKRNLKDSILKKISGLNVPDLEYYIKNI